MGEADPGGGGSAYEGGRGGGGVKKYKEVAAAVERLVEICVLVAADITAERLQGTDYRGSLEAVGLFRDFSEHRRGWYLRRDQRPALCR